MTVVGGLLLLLLWGVGGAALPRVRFWSLVVLMLQGRRNKASRAPRFAAKANPITVTYADGSSVVVPPGAFGDMKAKKRKRKSRRERRLKYSSYLRSHAWSDRRRAYYEKFGRACAVCGSDVRVELHHLSYAAMGCEPDDDLMALCVSHHRAVHQFVRQEGNDLRMGTLEYVRLNALTRTADDAKMSV